MKFAPVILSLIVCFVCTAQADERILTFHSDVTVNWDGTLDVVETILVRAEQNLIKRGIYRDFPTRYRNGAGRVVRVSFQPLSVTRDGNDEPYHTEGKQNGIRVYFGSADHFLSSGNYTYQFHYTTKDQLGYFADFDEIYWNVTGNDWDFPIDQASVRIIIPGTFKPSELRIAAYTGPEGSTDSNAEHEFYGDSVFFHTTQPLGVKEGLTVAVGFPKGLVRQPTAEDLQIKSLIEIAPTIVAITFFLLTLIVNLGIWWRVGRDPEQGTIIPRFKPPDNLSPAECRFIMIMGYDSRCFAAALINLAVNGWITIKEVGRQYTVTLKNTDGKQRSSGEEALMNKLFSSGNSVLFSNSNYSVVQRAIEALKDSLKAAHVSSSFRKNRFYVIYSTFMVLFMIAGITIASRNVEMIFFGILFFILVFVFSSIVRHLIRLWTISGKGMFSKLFQSLLLTFISVILLSITMGIAFESSLSLDLLPIGITAYIAAIAQIPIFIYLFKRPTVSGQKLRDEIEGFKMYLSVAERDQLALMKGPEKTPELFEAFLPYALALGVEQQWAEQFSDVLAAVSAPSEHGNAAYQPAWYHGSRVMNASAFSAAMGNSFNSAISSSSVPPGSSSGSGGGGSSGGGGGGGGGGGW